jgi:hypothetical protein
MGRLKLESCVRCKKGDVALDKDQYGWYEYCLQCGYVRDVSDFAESSPRQPVGVEVHLPAAGLSGRRK